ncbi:MAG: hypothetical protein MUE36_09795 [Acidimicrobiales bacterium]|jgi:hypothetical protein|nr:hypothetical protein [Acidimicrobiales bacterium]
MTRWGVAGRRRLEAVAIVGVAVLGVGLLGAPLASADDVTGPVEAAPSAAAEPQLAVETTDGGSTPDPAPIPSSGSTQPLDPVPPIDAIEPPDPAPPAPGPPGGAPDDGAAPTPDPPPATAPTEGTAGIVTFGPLVNGRPVLGAATERADGADQDVGIVVTDEDSPPPPPPTTVPPGPAPPPVPPPAGVTITPIGTTPGAGAGGAVAGALPVTGVDGSTLKLAGVGLLLTDVGYLLWSATRPKRTRRGSLIPS